MDRFQLDAFRNRGPMASKSEVQVSVGAGSFQFQSLMLSALWGFNDDELGH